MEEQASEQLVSVRHGTNMVAVGDPRIRIESMAQFHANTRAISLPTIIEMITLDLLPNAENNLELSDLRAAVQFNISSILQIHGMKKTEAARHAIQAVERQSLLDRVSYVNVLLISLGINIDLRMVYFFLTQK